MGSDKEWQLFGIKNNRDFQVPKMEALSSPGLQEGTQFGAIVITCGQPWPELIMMNKTPLKKWDTSKSIKIFVNLEVWWHQTTQTEHTSDGIPGHFQISESKPSKFLLQKKTPKKNKQSTLQPTVSNFATTWSNNGNFAETSTDEASDVSHRELHGAYHQAYKIEDVPSWGRQEGWRHEDKDDEDDDDEEHHDDGDDDDDDDDGDDDDDDDEDDTNEHDDERDCNNSVFCSPMMLGGIN